MATAWTPAQKLAIDRREGTVLVSAAAGSGKTAVLVQRMIERITDPENPGDVDRILMVTFSKKAAAEMRARVQKALSDLLLQDPENDHLKQQLLRLPQAKISTVHSFCNDLVREFSSLLPISSDFRIADENELALLKADAMEQLLEECYAQPTGEFRFLADLFSTDRSDTGLEKVIDQVDEFLSSHPFPKFWMEKTLQLYDPQLPAEQTVWGCSAMQDALDIARYYQESIPLWLSILEEEPEIYAAYADVLLALQQDLSRIPADIDGISWGEFREKMSGLTVGSPKAFRGAMGKKYPTDHPLRVMMKGLLDQMKKDFQKIAQESGDSLCPAEEDLRESVATSRKTAGEIFRMVLRYREIFSGLKAEQNVADYDDLEHWALAILCIPQPDGSFSRTEAAKAVAARFDEIMVDEYQDTNETQDTIFRAISRQEGNLFFVGDVKQSIYSFRQAMPQIFLHYRKEFPAMTEETDLYPGSITLDRNFRSRKSVTDFVNFTFSQIMSEHLGDVSYSGQDRLVCGADYYPDGEGYDPEFWLIDRERAGMPTEEEDAVLEGRLIAEKIHEMLDSGLMITDKAGQRRVREGDFCILLRTVSQQASVYARELNRAGLHASAGSEEDFFQTPEISLILNLLRVIDNPTREIPLLGVMMSALYGVSPDEISQMRLEHPGVNLYTVLVQSRKKYPKADLLLQDLEAYRAAAAVMRADELLLYLFRTTRILPLMQALPQGEERSARLYQLLDFASHFEEGNRTGLSVFLRYISRLEKNRTVSPEKAAPDSEKGVTILSVHKSKGLEFPIVILAGCGHRFHNETAPVTLHADMGLGVFAKEKGCSFVRNMILQKKRQEQYSEEMRILYVAMTRAKEKLIMVMTADKGEETLRRIYTHSGMGKTLPFVALRNCRCLGDWLLACVLRHPDSAGWRRELHLDKGYVRTEDAGSMKLCLLAPFAEKEEVKGEEISDAAPVAEDVEKIVEKVRYRYPYQEMTGTETKVTASEIAARDQREREPVFLRPLFLAREKGTGAEAGTAAHTYMQFVDYHAAAEDPVAEGTRLVEQGLLTNEQFTLLDFSSIRGFFESPLGKRMLRAGKLWREYRFAARIPASLIHPELLREEAKSSQILLQGAVDCLFEEEDGLVLVDYKTDHHVTPQQLWERYQKQIQLYTIALEKIFGKKVKERMLYSFSLQRPVWDPEEIPENR